MGALQLAITRERYQAIAGPCCSRPRIIPTNNGETRAVQLGVMVYGLNQELKILKEHWTRMVAKLVSPFLLARVFFSTAAYTNLTRAPMGGGQISARGGFS